MAYSDRGIRGMMLGMAFIVLGGELKADRGFGGLAVEDP